MEMRGLLQAEAAERSLQVPSHRRDRLQLSD